MKRSKFNLSHDRLLTCDMGELVPIGNVEVLPGDTVQHATSALIRLAPLLSPVMHPVRVNIHHWFVPYRLIWEDWEDFITGGPAGVSLPTYPTRSFTPTIGSLSDYLGMPITGGLITASALPYRAYALIWNEFYRDQDLQTELVISKASGNDTTTSAALQNANWEKDYFTSARPWEQKGPSITLPLGNSAPVLGIAGSTSATYNAPPGGASVWRQSDGSQPSTGTWENTSDNGFLFQGDNTTKVPNVRADLTNASAITVGALREALALQRYAEARARYGSRYVEYLRYLGVRSSDARLQRPEYLGGGRNTIQFSEVLQTAEGTNPVGEMRGHGIGALRSNRYRRFFEEHGVVMSLMVVRPKTVYQQGIPRRWNRRVKEDFWQRELQHIGQQEVLNKEVYAAHATPDGIFGYQDRYDEYRREESYVSGEFRTTLNYWHMAREFGSTPALNASFVSSVPTKRIFAAESEDGLYVTLKHKMVARRMVAKFGQSYIY